jgi:hypothetical protein
MKLYFTLDCFFMNLSYISSVQIGNYKCIIIFWITFITLFKIYEN